MEMEGRPLKDEDPLFVVLDINSKISVLPMDGSSVLHEVKVNAGRAGIKYSSIWTHVLRKAFRKVLNSCIYLDEDTRESMMGHKLPGSRGNYFDVHDIGEITEKYMKADWTEGAPSRLNGLEKTVAVQEDKIKKLETEKEELKKKLEDMSDLKERIWRIEEAIGKRKGKLTHDL
jgi:uncharacterized coiled-coil protein SlyX